MILIKRNLPKNIKQEDFYLFEKEFERKIPQPKIETIENCAVFDSGVVYKDEKLVPESLVDEFFADKYGKVFFSKARATYRKSKTDDLKKYLLCFDEWSSGYFHWICDAVQRMYLVKEQLQDSILLLPEEFKREYHLSLIQYFGANEIFWLPKKSFAIVKNLVFPHHLALTGNYNPDILQKFSSEIKTKKLKTERAEKIYVSRARRPKRNIVNEEEVEKVLSDFGFRTVFFEDYLFLEQVNIANKAKYLIGAHGAGLTNMLFMNPGSKVLELRAEKNTDDNCYFSLASAMDLDYYYQCCRKETPADTENKSNLVVDIEELKKNVALMLQ